ncbi:MAG TPA: KpsF/GutQ family sugar-phosphate isomerase [Planctomycetota bacterium]|nr:KpsF/GutQ family sugar-phosphate isomerase [Planctomycetota bacterium]
MAETANTRIERAREVLRIEADSVLALGERIGQEFLDTVDMILALKGKVVITGVGKSGIVGQKIAATMCSTGTPAVWLDATSALHGDLGVVAPGDLLIAISHSGEAGELLHVVFAAKKIGARIVAMTGSRQSTLALQSDLVLDVGVAREACPLGLAPTASTTATLAMGDALAMVLMQEIGFTRSHYARFHPGGNLGQRLKLKVRDIMRTGDDLPLVRESDPFQKALDTMTSKANLGVVLICDSAGALSGIITDGDLRRLLMHGGDVQSRCTADLMKRRPMTVEADAAVADALRVMEKGTGKGSITSLAIVDPQCRPIGLIHLHDILGRGQLLI